MRIDVDNLVIYFVPPFEMDEQVGLLVVGKNVEHFYFTPDVLGILGIQQIIDFDVLLVYPP